MWGPKLFHLPPILTIQHVNGDTCPPSNCAQLSRIYYKQGQHELFMLTQFPNQTYIYTPTAAYVTHLYGTSPRQDLHPKLPGPGERILDFPEGVVERSPLDFANEDPSQQSTGGDGTEDQGHEAVALEVPPPENVTTTGVAPEAGQVERIAATGPRVIKERRKKGNDGVDTNAPQRSSKGAAVARDLELENTSFTSMVGSPESIYRPEWGVTNGCLLDELEASQDLVDHIAPPGYFSELRHLHNDDFLKQYNINLARLRLRENEIKNLETLLEAETDMKKTAEVKNAELGKELENLRALFSDLQVSNDRLSQQVSTLQAQVTGEENLKAAFKEFKQYENNRVEKRCVEMNARLDALSIDFDEELYPHMLTAIIGHRWVIRHGLCLAVMKCGESTKLRQVFAEVVSARIAKGMNEGLSMG
uniref:Transposase (Putative), gypsy type n=1 Tax=Tanacetum cinerariifolium TaxID=118510 RepID=A0A699J3Z0_TANCI|nr:hypothetical protein [Tanacetum cinerariifolium]